MIDTIDEVALIALIKEIFGVEALAVLFMSLYSNDSNEEEDMLSALVGIGSYSYEPKKFDLNLNNRATPLARLSMEELLVLKLNSLPSYLCYAFLGPLLPY